MNTLDRPPVEQGAEINAAEPPSPFRHIPNVLSAFRAGIGLILVSAPLSHGWLLLSVLAAAAITDWADGFSARTFSWRTRFGGTLDLCADGAFFLGANLCLWRLGILPGTWLVWILVLSLPQLLSQALRLKNGHPVETVGLKIDKVLGAYSYCFVLGLAMGANVIGLGTIQLALQLVANSVDLWITFARTEESVCAQSSSATAASQIDRPSTSTTAEKEIPVGHFFENDRAMAWLFNRTKHPVLAFAFTLAPWYVGAFLICWIEQTLVVPPDITAKDFKSIPALFETLDAHTNGIYRRVLTQISPEATTAYRHAPSVAGDVSKDLATLLSRDLNGLIRGIPLWNESDFAQVNLSTRTKNLLKQSLQGEQLACLNRTLLVEAFPNALRAKPMGILEDVFMLTLPAVLILGLVMMRRLLRRVEELLLQLPEMVRAGQLPEDWEATKERIRRIIRRQDTRAMKWYWGLMFTALAFVVAFQLVIPIFGQPNPAWALSPFRYPAGFTFATLWSTFWFVGVGTNILWFAFSTGFAVFPLIQKLAENDRLWIVPNAPDGKGGLAPIGNVAFGITSTLGVGMVLVAIWILVWGFDAGGVLAGGTYTVVVCIAFFLPLQSAHGAMYRAKQKELRKVAKLFRSEYEALPEFDSLQVGTSSNASAQSAFGNDVIEKQLEKMTKLDALYHTVRKMPVWPFDMDTFRKFLLVALTPAISGLVHQIWPSLALGLPEAIKTLVNAG